MSSSARDPMHDLVEEYVLDLLDGAEKAAFEARLAIDPALAQNVRAAQEAITAAGMSTPVALPSELKARVMAHAVPRPVEDGEPMAEVKVIPLPPAQSRRAIWTTLALGGALAASLVVIVKQRSELKLLNDLFFQSSLQSDEELIRRDSVIARLTDPGLEVVSLVATGKATPPIKVYLDRTRRIVTLSAAKLEPAPPGRVYQLWFIVGDKPIPSVTFQPGADGRFLLDGMSLPDGDLVATAITVEPVGGSNAPTTQPIYIGPVKATQ